ncbi:MAG: flippase [Candidatus Woesearchaeota archaeon]
MKLGKQILWIYFLILVTGIFSYLVRIILAKNLSVYDYGLFYGIFNFIFLFSFLRDLGLTEASIFYINKYLAKKDYQKIKNYFFWGLAPQLLMGLLIASIFFIFADSIAINIFKTEKAKIGIILFGILFILETIIPTIAFTFSAFGRIDLFNLVSFVKFISLYFLLYLGFEIFGRQIDIALIFFFLGHVLTIFLIYLIFLKRFKNVFLSEKIEYKKNYFRDLFIYGFQVMLSTVGALLLIYTDSILLTILKGNEEVGYYNIAIPVFTILMTLISPIQSFVFPYVSEKFHLNEKKSIEKLINLLYNYSLLFTLPLSILFASFPELIIKTLFGEKYLEASFAVVIFSLSLIFYTIRDFNFGIIAGIGKVKERSLILLIGGIINLILDLILIFNYGKNGAALATGISFIVMAYLTTKLLKSEFKINLNLWLQFRIILAGIGFYLSIIFFRRIIELIPIIEAIVVTIISSIIYLILLVLLKVITKERIKILLAIMNTKFAKI